MSIADVHLQLRLHHTRELERGFGGVRWPLAVPVGGCERSNDAQRLDARHSQVWRALLLNGQGILRRVSGNIHQGE